MNSGLIKKICLGTAQFGMDYGIANKDGRAPKEEVFKILDCAVAKGIKTLDTAHAYGCSEKVLGEFIKKRGQKFDIVSKITMTAHLSESLARLGAKNIYGCLIHNFNDYVEKKNLWKTLKIAKENSIAQKIGFSFYKTQELETVLEEGIKFDIIQAPYNIFDRRFENYFAPLKDKGVEIHTRSIFLQGLFFLKSAELPKNLSSAKKHLELLKKTAKENNISISSLCLNFVLNNSYIDKAVIGVDSLKQLKQNINEISDFRKPAFSGISGNLNHLKLNDENILLPINWK